jgi:hypothetical protein
VGANNYYQPGGWNAICGECGDSWKASQMRKRWDGIWSCKFCYEARNPQDFLKGSKEADAVPYSNPEPPPVFV